MFFIYFGFTFLPASTSTVQLYAQFLSRSFIKSVSSIRNYLSGVRTVHLLLGFDLKKLNAFLINFSLRSMMRLKGHTVKKAESVTPDLLCNIFKTVLSSGYILILLSIENILASLIETCQGWSRMRNVK